MSNYFSPVAFFILLRESLEAGIIIAVLLGFVDQLMNPQSTTATTKPQITSVARGSTDSLDPLLDPGRDGTGYHTAPSSAESGGSSPTLHPTDGTMEQVDVSTVVGKMKLSIWLGALAGGGVALLLGAVILIAFHLSLADIWTQAEQLWESIFCFIASLLILVMGLSFLRMSQARIKWRIKLSQAFSDKTTGEGRADGEENKEGKMLFWLPFVTVLREGLEGVVFMGGVSLSERAESIPLAAVMGLMTGSLIAFLLYRSSTSSSTSSSSTLTPFLTLSTLLLLLLGSGLFSRSISFLDSYEFIQSVRNLDIGAGPGGGDPTESGSGPGSFRVKGMVWHFEKGNPEPGSVGTTALAQIANSLVGWNNTASIWSVSGYMAYWILVIAVLIYRKWGEGRMGKRRWLAVVGGEEEGLLSRSGEVG